MTKIFRLEKGDILPDKIVEIAKANGYKTASLQGIGGFNKVILAYFNHQTKKYEEIEFDEQFEVVSLNGNIALRDNEPFVHLHTVLSRRDMSTVGGHLTKAVVNPFIELIVQPTENIAKKEFDDKIGLYVLKV
ncbi:MAG TPA: PPC domain-containing DNA-binding protein [Geobacterales bacterium]|nr:PPC domain-containing DNA-binding protein [Geobacterales bacterium]